jgi:hypothetical protein
LVGYLLGPLRESRAEKMLEMKLRTAPKKPPHRVSAIQKWLNISMPITIAACFLALFQISCTSSKYFLLENINDNKPSNMIFDDLLMLSISNINNLSEKEFIRAFSDLVSIQTTDTIPNVLFTNLKNHIVQNFKNQQQKDIGLFLICLLTHRIQAASNYFGKFELHDILKNNGITSLPSYYLRMRMTNEANQMLNSDSYTNIKDALVPLRKRSINYYSILAGNNALPLLIAVNSQSKITEKEAHQLLPIFFEGNNFSDLRFLFAHSDELYISFDEIKRILILWSKPPYSSWKLDTLTYTYILSQNNLPTNIIKPLSEFICTYSLRTAAKAITPQIPEQTDLDPSCLIKLGWYIYDQSPDSTAKVWKIALLKLDKSQYDYKSTNAYISVIEGKDSLSRQLLKDVIVEYPKEALPRKVYLSFLLNDFDLNKLLNFLNDGKSTMDSSSFENNFGDLATRVLIAEILKMRPWSNSKGTKYWLFQDTSKIFWLYDRNLEPLNTSIFINKNNNVMFWVFENGKEYLYNEDNTYANQFRFVNSEGRYVYAIIQNEFTYYYDKDFKWMNYKSYTNKSGKEIFIKTVNIYDYYYNDSLQYMNIYAFKTKEGNKMFVQEKGDLQIYHDSTWKPTGLVGFSSNSSIYAFVYADNAKLYYYNEYSALSSLNLTIKKTSDSDIFIEDGDVFRYYYNINGEYLDWNIWMTGGEIGSISVLYKGNCKQYFKGSSDLTNCSSISTSKSNLYLEKKYLSKLMISELATLFEGKSETPNEIFSYIAAEIEKRKRDEITLAILQGINQGLESYNKSMETYRNKTYNNPYSTYISSYKSNTNTTNSYFSNSDIYTNSLSNSFSSSSYIPSQKSSYFSYSNDNGQRLSSLTNTLGNTTYSTVNGSSGYHGTGNSYSIGTNEYYNYRDNQGNHGNGSSYQIGGTTYYNYRDNSGNRLNASSTKIGDFEYFSGHDNNSTRYSGTSTKIGDFVYSNIRTSDGTSANGTTYGIGKTTFTNWNISK